MRDERGARTGKANEEVGDVDHIGRVARRVVVHLVRFPRLVLHDVEQNVNSGFGVLAGRDRSVASGDSRSMGIWPTDNASLQDRDTEDHDLRAFDAENCDLSVTLGDAVQVQRIGGGRWLIRRILAVEDVVWMILSMRRRWREEISTNQ